MIITFFDNSIYVVVVVVVVIFLLLWLIGVLMAGTVKLCYMFCTTTVQCVLFFGCYVLLGWINYTCISCGGSNKFIQSSTWWMHISSTQLDGHICTYSAQLIHTVGFSYWATWFFMQMMAFVCWPTTKEILCSEVVKVSFNLLTSLHICSHCCCLSYPIGFTYVGW